MKNNSKRVTPHVRIVSGAEHSVMGHLARVLLVSDDGSEQDVSRFFSGAEIRIQMGEPISAWLKAPLVSVDVEAELSQVFGERFYVRGDA